MAEGKVSALVTELRAAGHTKIADKQQALDELHAQFMTEDGMRALTPEEGHRELTEEERAFQLANALTVAEMKIAQVVEYGTYVATDKILHDGALAYDVGHPVPVSNVARYGYDTQNLVRRVKPPAKKASKPVDAKSEGKGAL